MSVRQSPWRTTAPVSPAIHPQAEGTGEDWWERDWRVRRSNPVLPVGTVVYRTSHGAADLGGGPAGLQWLPVTQRVTNNTNHTCISLTVSAPYKLYMQLS